MNDHTMTIRCHTCKHTQEHTPTNECVSTDPEKVVAKANEIMAGWGSKESWKEDTANILRNHHAYNIFRFWQTADRDCFITIQEWPNE